MMLVVIVFNSSSRSSSISIRASGGSGNGGAIAEHMLPSNSLDNSSQKYERTDLQEQVLNAV